MEQARIETAEAIYFFSGIGRQDLHTAWPYIHDMLQPAVEREAGDMSLQDIFIGVKAQTMQLWAVCKGMEAIVACAVTEILKYEHHSVCRIVAVSGDGIHEWKGFEKYIAEWASDAGCLRIEAICRPGFKRIAEPLGYKQTHIIISKDLRGPLH